MKICFILPKIIPGPNGSFTGGVTQCAVSLALALDRLGHDVHVFTTLTDRERRWLGSHPVNALIRPLMIPDAPMTVRGILAVYGIAKAVKKAHCKILYDVIHIHSGSIVYALIGLSGITGRVKLVHSVYCPVVHRGMTAARKRLLLLMIPALVKRIHCLVGVTRNICRSISHSKLAPSKIRFCPMAVDSEIFSPAGTGPAKGMNNRTFSFLFLGNASRDKGLEQLVNAMLILRQWGIACRLTAALENQSQRPDLKSRQKVLETLIRQAGMEDSISLLGLVGDVADLIRTSDCVVFPFQNISGLKGVSDYPMALLESMACGKCTVSTPFGGIPEIITHGDNGILCRDYQPESIAMGMASVVRNPEFVSVQGTRARALIEKRFNARHVANRLIDVYQGLER